MGSSSGVVVLWRPGRLPESRPGRQADQRRADCPVDPAGARTSHREVGQPGYVYAYEQTSLYPKITGYIEKWNVDIGDPLKKGQLLADLYVPELQAATRKKRPRWN